MDLDNLLSQSAKLEERIGSLFTLLMPVDSVRVRAVLTITSLGFEHARSLKYLVAARLCTSSAALLRIQFESLVRAIWVFHCATDAEAELIISELTEASAKRADKIPMLSRMLEEIERDAPHVPVGQLKEFKQYSWRPLSSYVHGGIHAVNRHGRGFPVELVCMQVRHSNGLLGLAGSLLQVIAGVPPERQIIGKLFEEFGPCFPPLEPASTPQK
ncbi:DUF6988 family protein [Pseudomonas sediminis]|uniref:DUF6988 family protein n=1 Tax=Pseudomonas sediminis TaxID=1691904 RepID=UPI0031CCABD8